MDTFQYIVEDYVEEEVISIRGFVSSYNSNTFKGRVYVPVEERPIPFELAETVRDQACIQLIVDSLIVG